MRKFIIVLTVLMIMLSLAAPIAMAATESTTEATVATTASEPVESIDATGESAQNTEAVESEPATESAQPSAQTEEPTVPDTPRRPTWFDKLSETFLTDNRYMWLIDGLKVTVIITIGALLIGVLIGTLIAITKYFCEDNPKLRVFNWLCDLYTTVIRGIPVTVLLLVFFFVIFVSARDGTPVAIIAFGINSGAYMAELIRSGINAVDRGQMEAARSLGMSKGQAMMKIILPQAIKYILPAIGNECIALLKETSVAGYVAVVDVTKAATNIRNKTGDAINPIIALALIYLVIVVVMTKLLGVLERRLRKSDGK